MFPRSTISLRATALVLIIAFGRPSVGSAQPAAPASETSTIDGRVVDTTTGLPLREASIELYRAGKSIAKLLSGRSGDFSFAAEPAGVYTVRVTRSGYQGAVSSDVTVTGSGERLTLGLALTASATTSLREIAAVTSSSTLGNPLATTSTISRPLNIALAQQENYVSVGEALPRLPGVDVGGTHSSAVGDDLPISLRGFDPSESQTLLDGHPIGPIGVAGGGFNFQNSPFFVLKNTEVVFGAGALGLYGTDATGGTIDMQTLDPTRTPQTSVTQGFGTLGRSFSALQATGSYGKLGYAVAGGTQGTSGNFFPQRILQNGLLGGNLSPAVVAANDYSVSGNFNLRDGLAKLQYTFLPGTVATVTAYSSQSYQDKTGIGDNDYTPYALAYANGVGAIDSTKGDPCFGSIPVTTNAKGGTACFSPAQYAQTFSGPTGGGQGRFKTIDNQDYHGRFVTKYLDNYISIDGFVDYYGEAKNSNVAASGNPTDGGIPCNADPNCAAVHPGATFFDGGFYNNQYKTTGFLVSDDLVRRNNEFGFGFYTQHQTYLGDTFGPPDYTIDKLNALSLGNQNVFMRDVFTPTPYVELYANVWYKTLSTTGADTVDPRATLVLRPSPNDVVRLIAGKTDGEPAAALASQNLTTVFGSINADCGTLVGLAGNKVKSNSDPVSIGQIGAKNLNQESSTDYEFAYGHTFHGGSNVQLAAYDEHEVNLLTSINVPIAPGQIPASLLSGYFGRIRNVCGQNYQPNLADLAASQAVNTSQSGLFRGIELSGRIYASPHLYFDLSYDLQHAQFFGYSNADYASNAYLINGGQELNIPLNKGTASADFTTRSGVEARIDGYLYGTNNEFNRGFYGYADGFVSYTHRGTGTKVTLGIQNLFNSVTSNYGILGAGVAPPLNPVALASGGVPTPPEEFGLLTRNFLVTLEQKL